MSELKLGTHPSLTFRPVKSLILKFFLPWDASSDLVRLTLIVAATHPFN